MPIILDRTFNLDLTLFKSSDNIMAKRKYVNLLTKTFEKYKDIETIGVSPTTSASEKEAQHVRMMPSLAPVVLTRNIYKSKGDKKEAEREKKKYSHPQN